MCASADPRAALVELEAEYEILDEVGRGGSAIVFRARDRALGRDVAIKVLRAHPHEDAEAVARLAREARTVAQLQHPNIVTLFGVRRLRDDRLALVMQLVPGRSLRELLAAEGPLAWTDAERILRDVAAALSSAHDAGIVHRDVKPENIFLDAATGRALLSDFGVARAIDSASAVTLPGSAIGTPAYMSPEQIDGAAPDARSDLYSLGLVGWEMLSGQRPWDGESLYRTIFKQKREHLAPLEASRDDLPSRLSYAIETLLEKNPDRRWGSARIFLAELPHAAPPAGWRRWRAERRRRIRAQSFDAARERGASIMGAALETVRFQRSASLAGATPVNDAPDGLVHPAPDLDASAPLPPHPPPAAAAGVPRDPPRSGADRFALAASGEARVHVARRRDSWRRPVWVAVAALLAAAGIGAALTFSRDDTPGLSLNVIGARDDARRVEVPVAPPPGAPTRTPPARSPSDSLAGNAVASDRTRASGDSTAGTVLAPADTTTRSLIVAGGTAATPADTSAAAANRAMVLATADSSEPVIVDTSGRGADTVAATASIASTPRVPATAPAPAAPAPTPSPAAVTFPSARSRVVAGGRHSCMLTDIGIGYCWGANDRGQLGTTVQRGESMPAAIAGGLAFAQVSAGVSHTCGVTRNGDVFCWGDNARGQLGDGTSAAHAAPAPTAVPRSVRFVRAGRARTCALARDGSVWCWGAGGNDASGNDTRLPDRIALDGATGALAVGWQHACAIDLAGIVRCWGANEAGQLGNGGVAAARRPVEILSSERFANIAAGSAHTCAVSLSDDVWCWGRNNHGQLGTGDRQNRATPPPRAVEVPERVRLVVAGTVNTCALAVSGAVWCWGRNAYGQLGDGTTVDSDRPVRVGGAPPFSSLSAGGAHVCGATGTGATWCWGYNVEGQLGDGTRENRPRPVRVAGSPPE